jgi:hypothetical protein
MAKNHFIMIKATKEEKERLEKLAKMEGFSTVTSFCRSRMFQSKSVEVKLNQILEEIKKRR